MSIRVRVHNKNAEWIEFDRPCFGFMSFIDQWDGDDIEEASSEEIEDEASCDGNGIENFESDNLLELEYIEHPFCGRSMEKDRREALFEHVKEAMKGLPQYYDTCTIKECGKSWDGTPRYSFTFMLEGEQMQKTTIAAMMLRNILVYSSAGLSFEELIKEGVEPHKAFVVAQAFPYSYSAVSKNASTFYRNHSNDETIFGGAARICDVAAMIKGEIPDPWQGIWGDTEDGYGRYGDYDGVQAALNSRTGCRNNLHDVVLLKEGYEDSPRLNGLDYIGDTGYGTISMPRQAMFDKFIPELEEALKSGS